MHTSLGSCAIWWQLDNGQKNDGSQINESNDQLCIIGPAPGMADKILHHFNILKMKEGGGMRTNRRRAVLFNDTKDYKEKVGKYLGRRSLMVRCRRKYREPTQCKRSG